MLQAFQLQTAGFAKHCRSSAYFQAGDRQASGLRKTDTYRQVGLSALQDLSCPATLLLSSLFQAPLFQVQLSPGWIAPLLCTRVGPRVTGGFLGLVTRGNKRKRLCLVPPSLSLSFLRPRRGRQTFHLVEVMSHSSEVWRKIHLLSRQSGT